MAWAGSIQAPVRLDTKGITGARRVSRATLSAKAGRIGSVMGEWNACEVARRRCEMPWASSRRSSAATAVVSPATTQRWRPLTAARASVPSSCARRLASSSATLSIAPAGRLCIRRPRSATSTRASSREKTPARQAATYSPTLWPISAAGCTPQSIHNRASAYSMTNSAGCAASVRVNAKWLASGSPSP
ncbi:hypothetical protein RPSA_47760 (plasmid) [Ralstonia solanacearum]|nr:hypothetical protein RPSA_47760 [Ralstonia solanacearum]